MSFLSEFKEFINRGNVMDMAVGVIVGGAFTTIVTSLTDKILNPLISLLGGDNLDGFGITLSNGQLVDFGSFISACINFLIIAFIVFLMVKAMNSMKKGIGTSKEEPESAPTCPFCLEEVKPGSTRCPHCAGEFDTPAGA